MSRFDRLSRYCLLIVASWTWWGAAAPCQSQSLPPPGSVSDQTPAGAKSPLLVGITVHHRLVTTDSKDAQRYFDQGLNLTYAFNHDEAIRAFREALRFDPDCALAWWGIALCHGPHINNPVMDEPRSLAAWEAIGQARKHSQDASPAEQALINALAQRYVANTADNIAHRAALNKRYADAMRRVHRQFPDDVDVAVLYAESLMDLRPWDLWSDDGRPRPETADVLPLLESALARMPNHPGANHLYIHAVEASPTPEKAAAAADRLRTLMPGSGHMVHMPAHIDVRTGKWSQAAEQNERAIEVDAVYRKSSPAQEFYAIYMLHNPHFLAFVCMMEGRQERGLQAARQTIASVPAEFLEHSAALADHLMTIEYQVLVRFGRWDQLLALPAPREDLPISTAMWRFSRATAWAAQGNIAAAEREQSLFRDAVAAVPQDAMGAINRAEDILQVGEHTLAGEIAFQKGDLETAVDALKKGVAAEDRLLYMEPPEWIQPVRHSLGAVLVAAQRWGEAEQVYRADLAKWPENGWSLYGLARCLRAQGDTIAADQATRRFHAAWKDADTEIDTTCLCTSAAGNSNSKPLTTTDDVNAALDPLLCEYYPDAKVVLNKETLTVKAATMTYTLHPVSRSGEIGEKTFQTEGPKHDGFILQVTCRKGRRGASVGLPIATPRANRGPYWRTFLNEIYHPASDRHLWITYDYGERVDSEFNKKLLVILGAHSPGTSAPGTSAR